MSFSSEVKQELAELTADKPCCRAALAYGLLEFGHAFTGSRMSLQTEHAAVAHLYSALAADVCGIAPPAVQTLPRRGGFCIVSVEGDAPRARVLERFGHSPADLAVRLNRANLECDGCAPALLRGAFLACGAVIDPASGYHMEFSVPYYTLCRDLLALLRELGFHAKQVCRKGAQVVYLKESEQIEDCLTLMGATNASLELMGIKMVKDIRNNANRVTNCESANIDKTVAAAAVHLDAVRKIEAHGGLALLPEELREVARLRLENPDMSLRELGETMDPPLSRSGINHRLRRIVEHADKLP